MKKKILSMLLVGTMALSMTACGSGKESGVSEAEYDKVVKERDQYKEELEEIKKKEEESKETKEFKVGETWEVDGKFKVTVNSVIATDYRNQFDESNPAAVYVINYTYENIGLKEDLYVNFESKVVDNAGKVASSYPGDTEKYPESVPTGAFCEAEVTIGVENAGSFKDYVSPARWATPAHPISPRRRRYGPAAGWCRWGCRRPSGPSRQPNVSPPCPFRCRRKTACWRGRLCRKFWKSWTAAMCWRWDRGWAAAGRLPAWCGSC